MIGNVAVKKEMLPAHAWKNMAGKEKKMAAVEADGGRVARMNALPEWRQREIASEKIVDDASKMKVAPLSRKEIDAWTAKLLDANVDLNNHSC